MIQCDREDILLSVEDFDCIGQVARHCDWSQLCIYIREQQNLTLLPKIGQCLYTELYNYITTADSTDSTDSGDTSVLHDLWCGSEYIGCGGEPAMHFGLERVLVHYAYGAYIYRHGYVDTPFGVVQKMNQDSVPAPMNELRKMMQEHQHAGDQYWQMTKDYLCTVKDEEVIKKCMDDYFGCKKCNNRCTCKDKYDYKYDYRCGTCCQKTDKYNIHDRGLTFANISKFD